MPALRPAAATLLLMAACTSTLATAEDAAIRLLPVPVGVIEAGEVIEPAKLTARRFQTTQRSISGIVTAAEDALGMAARRRLLAGRPIPFSALTRPLAVRRGARSVASYRETGFSISTPVTLLEDGAAGDTIDARAISTGAVLKVEVGADGSLSVAGE